jgi:spore coat protein U-like protein
MFKKIATAATVTAALFVATQAQAGSDTSDTLKINGTVSSVCTVSIEDMSQTLNLVQGANKTVVGKITETCNAASGYTIRIASANAGKLVNAANGNAKVDYTVDYDNRQNAQLNSELVQNYGNQQAYGAVKELKVSVSGNANRVAGAYADTLTVTIAAN